MDLLEIGKNIGKAMAGQAPFLATAIGTALGGPGGGVVAGLAGTVIKKYFGTGPEDPQALMTAIQQDPQAAAKFILAEMEFKLELRRIDVEEVKAFLGDVQNARNREIEVVKATGKKDLSTEAMAWFIIVGFFVVLVFRMLIKIEPGQAENVGLMIGTLITVTGCVVQYKWGSSKGSAEKSAILEREIDKPGRSN